MKTYVCSALVVLFIGLLSFQGHAQAGSDTGQIDATATVVPQLTVSGVDNMRFPNLLSSGGTNLVIAATDARAGSFTISTGANNAGVDLTFTLPTQLDPVSSDGTPTPIGVSAFMALTNIVNSQTGAPFGVTSGNPTASTLNASGELFVWLGGTLNINTPPPGGYDQGSYSATITLSVDYN